MSRSYLVTGGTGFLGSALVRRLVVLGHRIRVLDSNTRGRVDRLKDVWEDIEFIQADIRDAEAVEQASRGVDSICHLAFINGTEFFYQMPALVLDVGVKGMINVIDACKKNGVAELILASSSEVYQSPPTIPTDETVPLSIPDPLNPRYSYAGAKVISELLAINHGRSDFERVVIFRPHNVYGPEMGWEHVIPQFVLRMRRLCQQEEDPVRFPIQGTCQETRAFVYVDDLVDGVVLTMERGEHLGIYHVGTTEEVTIQALAGEVGRYFGRDVRIVPGERAAGGTLRRCPDIGKLGELGYRPRVSLREGLPIVARWYDEHADLAPVEQQGDRSP